MEQNNNLLLNGLPDISGLAEEVKLKGYPDKLMPKFKDMSRTTIFRCIKGKSSHDKAMKVRKEYLKLIQEKKKEIEEEENMKHNSFNN